MLLLAMVGLASTRGPDAKNWCGYRVFSARSSASGVTTATGRATGARVAAGTGALAASALGVREDPSEGGAEAVEADDAVDGVDVTAAVVATAGDGASQTSFGRFLALLGGRFFSVGAGRGCSCCRCCCCCCCGGAFVCGAPAPTLDKAGDEAVAEVAGVAGDAVEPGETGETCEAIASCA